MARNSSAIPLDASQKRKEMMYRGHSLLAYDGDKHDYRQIGRFLAKTLLTRDEREKQCWFPSKQAPVNCDRIRVPKFKEKLFTGLFLS